jgi:hypothetical protein
MWGTGDIWSHKYPTQTITGRWAPSQISVIGQPLVPDYYVLHGFSGDEARHAFEQLVDRV